MYVEIGSVFKCRKSLLPSGSGVQCGRDHQPLRANEPVGLRGSFEGRLIGAIVFHVRVVQDELRMLHKRLLHSVGCSAMLFFMAGPLEMGALVQHTFISRSAATSTGERQITGESCGHMAMGEGRIVEGEPVDGSAAVIHGQQRLAAHGFGVPVTMDT